MHGCLLREAHLEMHHTCKQVRNLVVQFSTPDIIHRYTVFLEIQKVIEQR